MVLYIEILSFHPHPPFAYCSDQNFQHCIDVVPMIQKCVWFLTDNFPVVFSLLISCWVPILSKNTLGDFNGFKFVEVCFPCTVQKKCAFYSCWTDCSVDIDQIPLADGVVELVMSRVVVLSIVERRALKSAALIVDLPVPPFSCIHLLQLFCSSFA